MPFFGWLILSVAAAGVPLALHLLQKKNPVPLDFAALRFLKEAVAKTRRARQISNLFLLALRMLIMFLLVLVFANPRMRGVDWLPDAERTVIVLLDSSAGMRYRDGRLTLFERAKEWVLDTLEMLEDGDKAAVFAPGAGGALVYPPISDEKTLAASVDELQAGWGGADMAGAAAEVVELLESYDVPGGVELHLFSDFQQNAWPQTSVQRLAKALEGKDVAVFLNRVRPASPGNTAVRSVRFHPPVLLNEMLMDADVTISVNGNAPQRGSISWMIDGKTVSMNTFRADESGRADSAFSVSIPEVDGNQLTGSFNLQRDACEFDDRFFFSVSRSSAVPVLLVDGGKSRTAGERDILYLRAAFSPKGSARGIFKPVSVSWKEMQEIALEEFAIVCICNPPQLDRNSLDRIKRFALAGGTVILFPGERNAFETLLPDDDLLGKLSFSTVKPPEATAGILGSAKPTVTEKKVENILKGIPPLKIRKRLSVGKLPRHAVRLWEYANGDPFLSCIRYGKGEVWISSLTANRDWSEWTLSPFFVILFRELPVSLLRSRKPTLMIRTGETLPLSVTSSKTSLEGTIIQPDGSEKRFLVSRASTDTPFLVEGLSQPGIYTIRTVNSVVKAAVNVPENESEHSYLSRDAAVSGLHAVPVLFAETRNEHEMHIASILQGKPLAPVLLVFLLLLLIGEGLLSNMYCGRMRGATPVTGIFGLGRSA